MLTDAYPQDDSNKKFVLEFVDAWKMVMNTDRFYPAATR